MRAYLDSAATTSLAPEVLEAMLPFLRDGFGNPSSTHSHGREVRSAVEKARRTIAEQLNAFPSEIYFTSGGTEADNTFLRGTVATQGTQHVISSPLEHHAVLHTLEDLAHRGTIQLHFVEHDQQGVFNLDHLAALLGQYPHALVSLMHGNNELGNLNPLAAIAELCKAHGATFHSDTVQTIGYYPLNTKELHAQGLVGAAHKFHGPKGVGFLYLKKGFKVSAFVTGGGQERNLRGGTENTYAIIGMAKALELSLSTREKALAHMRQLKAQMIALLHQHLPTNSFTFHGLSANEESSLPSVLNVGISHPAAGMLLFNLDLQGISASGGSACSSGSQVGSHVISALNLPVGYTPVRFSFSKYTTLAEVKYAVEQLAKLLS